MCCIYQLLLLLLQLFKVQMFGPEIQQFYRGLVQDTMKMRDRENITRPDMIQLLMQVRKGTLKHEDTPDVKDAGFATVTESTVGKATNNRSKWIISSEITNIVEVILYIF